MNTPIMDVGLVAQMLRVCFAPGEIFEVRVLEALSTRNNRREHTEAGYFDIEHLEELVAALKGLIRYKGVYFTLNPLAPAVLGRSKYTFRTEKLIGAKDEEVVRRRWLPIDCDARRVSGVSSSEQEHIFALQKAEEIRTYLSALGFPPPLFLDSGNGAQLLYRVDLPAQDEGVVKGVIRALKRFSDERVEIDQSVFNPARIWRLPGTWNCKGDECPEQGRIHRQSRIVELPEGLARVTREQLVALSEDAQRGGLGYEAQQTPHAPLLGTAKRSADGSTPHSQVRAPRGAMSTRCERSEAERSSAEPRFDIEAFMAEHFPEAQAQAYNGGRKWVLEVCPFNSDHADRSAVVVESAEGRLGFKCHHNGCSGKDWHALRALYAPRSKHPTPWHGEAEQRRPHSLARQNEAQTAQLPTPNDPLLGTAKRSADGSTPKSEPREELCQHAAKRSVAHSLSALAAEHPERKGVLIEGVLRETETANIIAAPKTGKTWLMIQLAICLALGRPWMDLACTRKRVMVIDNELHPEELVHRYRMVLEAMKVEPEALEGWLYIASHRGALKSIDAFARMLPEMGAMGVEVVIVDAFYRTLPKDIDENSNIDIMRLYNTIDQYAKVLNAAFILVHHTSKGVQNNKVVTDLGAGAGAQSRAADTHLALLRHAVHNAVVVKGVTRSFTPLKPFCLRQRFPLWVRDDTLNPEELESAGAKAKCVKPEVMMPMLADARVGEFDLAALLKLLGGSMTKTKFHQEVMQRYGCSRQKAYAEIDLALQSGRLLSEEGMNRSKQKYLLLLLPEAQAPKTAEPSAIAEELPF